MLDKLKLYLGITGTDSDKLLTQIIDDTSARLCVLLGGASEVPTQLEYIVTYVSAARFNQIGSEGTSSHTVEGETMGWSGSDFDPFMDDINAYNEANQDKGRGVIRFL